MLNATVRVRINPNLRLGKDRTMVDLDEDVFGDIPLSGAFQVVVFEPESGLTGWGFVVAVDTVERTVELSVDWGSLQVRGVNRGGGGGPW